MSLPHPPPTGCDHAAPLGQIINLLESLDPTHYRHACPVLNCGSVGGHVRHCIEFYQCYNNHPGDGLNDYDARPRDLDMETDPIAACLTLRRLLPHFEEIARTIPEKSALKVRKCGAVWLDSTHGRERRFLFSHTIHHMALIAVLLRSNSVNVPENFGVAPSTLAHRRNTAQSIATPCAR